MNVANYFEHELSQCVKTTGEILPWDLVDLMKENKELLLLDVREPYEFDALHIKGSINVPRGILETACEYGYEETVPELVESRERDIIVICRSGKRSLLAARTMQSMGYKSVKSLKLGVRGWNDYEQSLQDQQGNDLDTYALDILLTPRLRPEQLPPKRR
jgi:rhodanese-related sulfurtransferase